MKRPVRLVIFIFITIVGLSIVRVGLENSISTTGTELVSLQEKIENYKKANSVLKERYLAESSLTKIALIAKEKGFVTVKNQMYLSTPLPLALKQ